MLWIGLYVTDYATVVLKSDDAFGLAGPEPSTPWDPSLTPHDDHH